MALFSPADDPEAERLTFKAAASADIVGTFFNQTEHADLHTVDGKEALIILEVEDAVLKERDSHWEGGAKQSLDTGLYSSVMVLYIKAEDYGPRPKMGKQLVLDAGTKEKRTFKIKHTDEEQGIYRFTLERVRQ